MDTQKYRQVMQNIKGRMEYVNSVYYSAESMRKVSVFMVESICLQLRTAIEDIAVACIIANSDEMPKLSKQIRNEYSPSSILKYLEKINSECYPIPMVENVEGSHGNFRDTYERPEGDWLTRDEAISTYGKLSEFIHQRLRDYDGSQINFLDTYQNTKILASKIYNLLSHHQLTVLDEDKMYRVLMSSSSDGGIQITEWKRIDELPDSMN